MKRTALLLASLTFVAASGARAQDLGRNQEAWTWDGHVASGNWFRLSSINGPVTVEPSSDNMVHVRAEKDVGSRGRTSDVAFQVIQEGGDVRVCALWRDDVCDDDGLHRRRDRDRDDDNDRRDVKVRFTVKVPSGVRLSAGTVNGEMRVRDVSSDVRASTVNGRVEVRNVGGPVRATTVNGSVDVTTRTGPVEATTVNGSVDVRMSELKGDGDMKFSTVNGDVTVETPASLDARVRLGTLHGSITSDYPVQLSGRFGPRRAEGTIGRGGREIEMETVNGSIELRKVR
ncbi:MAG TPA: DUF4097 family beta strand repeat-containing protein [Gemmatimonadaceae bacterium]|nr:DUF4097 family beta strand repeat-containing protein [Gemmatimonadaceae bacterium]